MVITNSYVGSYAFKFNIARGVDTKAGHKYAIEVSDAEFYDSTGEPCLVTYGSAGVSIVKNSMDFLAEKHDNILDYLIDAQQKTAIVVG